MGTTTMNSYLHVGKVVGGGNITHDSITITNVEHASGLTFNLISVGDNSKQQIFLTSIMDKSTLWHRRLGYGNMRESRSSLLYRETLPDIEDAFAIVPERNIIEVTEHVMARSGTDLKMDKLLSFKLYVSRCLGPIYKDKDLVIMEYLVNISKRRAFWSLNKDIMKITILTNTSYPSRKIRRICACTHQRPQRKHDQYAVSREDQYAVLEINNANPLYQERRQSMEDTLSKFTSESTKRHEENSNWIKEIRASTDAAIRNQGASIKTLEIQVRQMSKIP
ncbi:hypothetical protein Tco_0814199 [Tanacetum coccineum]